MSLQGLNLVVDRFKSEISKPLRPIWITPSSPLLPTDTVFEEFHPIICCTVSRRVAGGELSEGGYIQGAGDDTENWAHGLTPSLFWANRAALLSAQEADLPHIIEELVRQPAGSNTIGSITCLKPTSCLFVGALSTIREVDNATCVVSLLPKVTDQSTWHSSITRLDVGLGPHKIGSRNLRTALPVIVTFVKKHLIVAQQKPFESRIVLACGNGEDLSIGAALALLCLFFAEDGNISESIDREKINKTFIRRRLAWISTSLPKANPSRSTLQSVNSFLMDHSGRYFVAHAH
jgi:tRNA A64-2'-O-ribosylphosphate transferase